MYKRMYEWQIKMYNLLRQYANSSFAVQMIQWFSCWGEGANVAVNVKQTSCVKRRRGLQAEQPAG